MRLGFRIYEIISESPILYQYWDENPPADIASWMARGVAPSQYFSSLMIAWPEDISRSASGADAEAAYLEYQAPAMKADLFRYCALCDRRCIH